MAARLVWQKGLDLVLADTGLFGLDAQFVFLGAGEPRYEDALRRDFRINALFYDLEARQVLDWVGGMEDLRRQVVHTIGDPETRFPPQTPCAASYGIAQISTT